MSGSTSILIRSPSVPNAFAAKAAATVSRLSALDPGTDYATASSVEELPDTTMKNRQWDRPRGYYGQSIWGTGWPVRYAVSFVEEGR